MINTYINFKNRKLSVALGLRRFREVSLRAVAWWVADDAYLHHWAAKPISPIEATEATRDDAYQRNADDHHAKTLNNEDRTIECIRYCVTLDIVPGFFHITVFTHESSHTSPITVVLFRIVV